MARPGTHVERSQSAKSWRQHAAGEPVAKGGQAAEIGASRATRAVTGACPSGDPHRRPRLSEACSCLQHPALRERQRSERSGPTRDAVTDSVRDGIPQPCRGGAQRRRSGGTASCVESDRCRHVGNTSAQRELLPRVLPERDKDFALGLRDGADGGRRAVPSPVLHKLCVAVPGGADFAHGALRHHFAVADLPRKEGGESQATAGAGCVWRPTSRCPGGRRDREPISGQFWHRRPSGSDTWHVVREA